MWYFVGAVSAGWWVMLVVGLALLVATDELCVGGRVVLPLVWLEAGGGGDIRLVLVAPDCRDPVKMRQAVGFLRRSRLSLSRPQWVLCFQFLGFSPVSMARSGRALT